MTCDARIVVSEMYGLERNGHVGRGDNLYTCHKDPGHRGLHGPRMRALPADVIVREWGRPEDFVRVLQEQIDDLDEAGELWAEWLLRQHSIPGHWVEGLELGGFG